MDFLLLVGFLGGEARFELLDDAVVHVLVDLDGQEEDDEAGDDAGERQVVGAGLERADVLGIVMCAHDAAHAAEKRDASTARRNHRVQGVQHRLRQIGPYGVEQVRRPWRWGGRRASGAT